MSLRVTFKYSLDSDPEPNFKEEKVDPKHLKIKCYFLDIQSSATQKCWVAVFFFLFLYNYFFTIRTAGRRGMDSASPRNTALVSYNYIFSSFRQVYIAPPSGTSGFFSRSDGGSAEAGFSLCGLCRYTDKAILYISYVKIEAPMNYVAASYFAYRVLFKN